MDGFLKRAVTFLLSLFLLFYVGYQIFMVVYNPIKTETISSNSLYDTVEVEMVSVRNEKVIKENVDGFLSYNIANGERVASGGTIAQVFAEKNDSLVQKELDYVTNEIKVIEEVEKLGDVSQTGLSAIETNMWQGLHQLAFDTDKSQFSYMSKRKSEILSLINKRQLTIGKSIDFSDRKRELKDEKKRLEGSFTKAKSEIKAPISGYFVNGVDGYEERLTIEKLPELTSDDISKIISEYKAISESGSSNSGFVGKVVGDFEWYLVCSVPLEDSIDILADNDYEILFPFVSDTPVPTKLISSEKDGKGNVVLKFKCNYMSDELSSVRVATAQIRVKEYEGLQVLSSRVVRNADGERGVFTLVGDTITFKKIDILYSNHEYVICDMNSNETKSGYLRLYDTIVVEGSGLYDGQSIS